MEGRIHYSPSPRILQCDLESCCSLIYLGARLFWNTAFNELSCFHTVREAPSPESHTLRRTNSSMSFSQCECKPALPRIQKPLQSNAESSPADAPAKQTSEKLGSIMGQQLSLEDILAIMYFMRQS